MEQRGMNIEMWRVGAGMDVLLISAVNSPKVCLNNKLAFN